MIAADNVARVQRQTRWRQFQNGTFAPDPSLHQRAAAAALGFFRRYGQWDGLRGARGVHRDAAGFDLGCVIILVGARHLPFKAVCLKSELERVLFRLKHILRAEGNFYILPG